MSASAWIARTGVNPLFIAFNAHCWFAFMVVHTLGFWSVLPALACAAAKEFWFDARYEVPKQDFNDNLDDFLGYTAGIILASLALMLKL